MKLRTKLLLAQLPLAVALLAVGLLAVVGIERLGGHSQTILKDNYRSVLAAQRMKEASERMDSAALFQLAGHWDEGASVAEEHRRIFGTELCVEEGNITETGEAEAAERLRTQWNDYQEKYDQFISQTDLELARQFYFDTLFPLFFNLKESANRVLELNQDAMVRKSDRVKQIATHMTTVMVFSTMVASLVGIFASILLTRRLLHPLSVLSLATRRLGEGDLAVRAQIEGEDEIARLAAEFNAMAEHLEKYRRSSLGELFQAQQTTQAAIDSLPDPVMVFDLEGHLINLNAASERFLGLSL
ncbi:MAG TPA: HAMP domain-containing protein, partial [Candidatus Sumerlaeota bacterium]|nr:HAMP domain-containing protein [Candidatus Sumerlaeota bacterium]